jgi:hypothetical protein
LCDCPTKREGLFDVVRNGTLSSPVDVFHASTQLLPQLYEDLLPNQAPKPAIFSVNFTDEDYYAWIPRLVLFGSRTLISVAN